MSPLAKQNQRLSGYFTAPFVVFRLLTPLGMKYEAAVQRAEPYNKIVKPFPEMRKYTLQLVSEAMGQHWRAYVLVNGSAPLTVQALVDRL